MSQAITKELLFDFFAGKTTSIQRKLIEEWIAQDKNEELYYQYLDEWEGRTPQFMPNLDQAWQQHQIIRQNPGLRPLNSLPNDCLPTKASTATHWWWSLTAACLLLTLGFIFRTQLLFESYQSPIGKITRITLSDGTRVTLNANSSLRVPRYGFGTYTRIVQLLGEAEFNVTHLADNKRFVVKMDDDYQIEVLGTEFLVSSRRRGKQVFLTKGRIKLGLPAGKQLYLKPGTLFLTTSTNQFKVTRPKQPKQYAGWKDHMFYFDDTPLTEVAFQLEDRFGVRVRIMDTLLADRRIGGTYKAETADDMLQILTDLLQIEVIQQDNLIELRTDKRPQ